MTTHEHYTLAAAEYLSRLRWRNVQPTTMRNYKSVLDAFGAFLATQPTSRDLYGAVSAWQERLLSAGKTPSTVRQYLTTLKIFFDKATKRSFPEHLRFAENPVDTDEAPKAVTRPYEELLTDEQAASLFANTPPSFRFQEHWPRTYAMLMLLLNEKIRNAELLDLRLCDLDLIHHELTIESGKGRKYRVVDLCELSETAVELYLTAGIRPAYLPDDAPLFGTTAAHRYGAGRTDGAEPWHRGSSAWLSALVERTVYEKTGVHDIRTHDLRHIGARICLNAGTSLEQLQGELGHSDSKVTERYSGRLLQRRRRESAKAVLDARAAAAEANRAELRRLAEQDEDSVLYIA